MKQLDYSTLKSDEATQNRYESAVKLKLEEHNCANQLTLGDALEHFRLAVTEAASDTIPIRPASSSLPKRYVSENTRTLYDLRQKNYNKMSKEELISTR